jgi:8-oxo-dGTP pyrophosphatase MutT (NUDIX family)
MTRDDLRQQLVDLELENADEARVRERMLALLDGTQDCFFRSAFPGHFTGSALVVDASGSRALLHYHRKLAGWMQFGGHCDGDENLPRVAQREALEESGIEGLILASARPFDLDLHEIPARGQEPSHWHYDVRYVLIAPENAAFQISDESLELRWFTPDECDLLPLDSGLRRLVAKWRRLLARRGGHTQ